MNLVPWFPEIAVLAGAAALVPALLGMRRAAGRPVPSTFVEPGLIALVALVALDGLISARTGASFALGALATLSVQWIADFGIESRALGLAAWGTALLGLGLVFELFGAAAGMDEGGWKLLAQLIAAFALGSALITASRKADARVPERADAGVFAVAGALIIAASTPFVANRVDGVAFPMLVLTAASIGGAFALLWTGPPTVGLVAGAILVGLLAAVAAAGLDPVALGFHESSLPAQVPLLAGLLGVLLGVAVRLLDSRRWTIVLVAASLLPFHFLGTYGVAVGALSMMAAVPLPVAPGGAVTVLAVLGLVAASHSGTPLITPSHWAGWFHTFLAAGVVGVIGAAGRGPRVALLRVAVLVWIVIGPFLV